MVRHTRYARHTRYTRYTRYTCPSLWGVGFEGVVSFDLDLFSSFFHCL